MQGWPAPGNFRRPAAASCRWRDLFRLDQIMRVTKTGDDIFAGDVRVAGEYVVNAPSVSHHTDDEFDRYARSPNGGLSGQYGRVANDTILLVGHTYLLLKKASRRR